MNLENYRSTWRQLKVRNGLVPLAEKELLITISQLQDTRQSRLQRVLVNAILFLIMIVFIQGG